MDPQEIFDTVAKHLLTQGKKAVDKYTGLCTYRAPDGLKCAVGCLIPDDVYKPEMDNGTSAGRIDTIYINFPEVEEYLGIDNLSLLCDLQDIHDVSDWRSDTAIKHSLECTANDHNLDKSVLTNFKDYTPWNNQ
jgi:hypothetical protein